MSHYPRPVLLESVYPFLDVPIISISFDQSHEQFVCLGLDKEYYVPSGTKPLDACIAAMKMMGAEDSKRAWTAYRAYRAIKRSKHLHCGLLGMPWEFPDEWLTYKILLTVRSLFARPKPSGACWCGDVVIRGGK